MLFLVLTNICFAEIITQHDTIEVKQSTQIINLSKKYILPESIDIDILSGNCNHDSMQIDALRGRILKISCKDSSLLDISYQYVKIDISENRILNPYPEVSKFLTYFI